MFVSRQRTVTNKREEKDMPYVNIKVTKEGVSADQKLKLIQGTAQLLFDVLGKPPQTTYVVIEEVETDSWGVGMESITQIRKKAGKGTQEAECAPKEPTECFPADLCNT
jgi:4-oxalocrotonate tautomerase